MPKTSKIKAIFSKRNIIISAFLIVFLVQFVQVQLLLGNFGGKNTSYLKELGQMREAFSNFTGDLSEVRDYLRLPKKNYDGLSTLEDENDKNEKQIQLAMFKFINNLSSSIGVTERTLANQKAVDALVINPEFLAVLSTNSLTLEQNEYELLVKDGEKLLISVYLDEDGNLYRETVKDGIVLFKYDGVDGLSTILSTYITANKAEIVSHLNSLEAKVSSISTLLSSATVQKDMQNLNLRSDMTANEVDQSYVFNIYGKLDNALGQIILDKASLNVSMIDTNNTQFSLQSSNLATSLVPFIEKLDNRTFTEKKYFESLAEIKETLNDKGFKLLLKESGLSIANKEREDEGRIYFDILDLSGAVLNSIALEKATGVVNIVDSKGASAENLLFFDPKVKKKTIKIPNIVPKYGNEQLSDKNSFNILIAGKNGSLIDTMIFAHINEITREVSMISIPRDLFYDGRKINAYAFFYGMPELKKVLSEISGYKLDKFILVDMYAFIDVINLIGGIDITLTEPVIDPTYRTVDNGVEGTLHYEPGNYHLSGVQALRLARTRHTSSDFARAERQQMILKSIQNKAKNLGFGDAKTIYEIVKAVLKQTETDISFDEAIAYFFRYQSYNIVSNDVISSGNILYSPPYNRMEDCQVLIDAATSSGTAAPACIAENHAYTLIPKDGNWDIIKWFFRDHFGK